MTGAASEFRRVAVGGVPFAVTNLADASDWLVEHSVSGSGLAMPIRLSNAYCVALADSDSDYRDVLAGPGVNLPDGTPIVWFARRADADAGRVRGPSFFLEVIDKGQDVGVRHFFVGSTPETLSGLERQLSERYPRAILAGSYSPPFGPLDDSFYASTSAHIAKAAPHIVWVGMGTPKQDFASLRLAELTGLPCVGVGAAFDFTAGTVREAPKWIQNAGIEWAYRLAAEPRRLWKRYLIGNVQFLRAALRPERAR